MEREFQNWKAFEQYIEEYIERNEPVCHVVRDILSFCCGCTIMQNSKTAAERIYEVSRCRRHRMMKRPRYSVINERERIYQCGCIFDLWYEPGDSYKVGFWRCNNCVYNAAA